MSNFVDRKNLALHILGATNARLIKFYLMNAILTRAEQAEAARAKNGGKSASGRYIPFAGTVEFSFKGSTGAVVVKKSSRYMTGRLNALEPVEQTREVHFVAGDTDFQYSVFVELKDGTGREIATMISTKQVRSFKHEIDRNMLDVELLNEVAADMFSFLYSQRPEEKAMKELRLQRAA
jgi:hypothetical protein